MIIKLLSDGSNMTYEHYMNQPMPSIELGKNFPIARNPQLINSLHRNKNHP